MTKQLNNNERIENERHILEFASKFMKTIATENKEFVEEIEGIAEGADVDPLWIYALNSRSEIMSNMENGSTECTALYFKESKLLGQNWDWAADFEELAVIMQIKLNNGVEILQITEPGIIGKIGFNNFGLGVSLNFLHVSEPLNGFPIHLILRSILEKESFSQAIKWVNNLIVGCAGNIIIADNNGNYQDIEFGGEKLYFLEVNKSVFMHTNHFLKNITLNQQPENMESSFSRYEKASSLISNLTDQSLENMKNILSDESDTEFPICRKYIQGKTMEDVGTVCTIIMDLEKLELNITKGSPSNNNFSKIKLNK
ncbi:MAG: hypothetical protein HeimC2_34440 [Candidatus Heimdallarchaeota archaeon LC_2]|nr:MAG: hypothetical protein HeimC2_34440 [Candidatus Heimdallarchaeota archaeon LC_2]